MAHQTNPHTGNAAGESTVNPHIGERLYSESVSDPTTDGNGDVSVTVGQAMVLDDTDDVIGASITGTYKASVQAVSGNVADIRIQEPDGAGGFQAVTSSTLTGETLDVHARA